MTTAKEIVYMILDELKYFSTDAEFTQEHALFLASKYRAYYIEQKWKELQEEAPRSLCQIVCVDLENVKDTLEVPSGSCTDSDVRLRSKDKVPDILCVCKPMAWTSPDFTVPDCRINMVLPQRMAYVGSSKWTKSMIYCCIGPDKHLWIKSSNPQLRYLQSVRLSAVFHDPVLAASMSCSDIDKCKSCDSLETDFHIEDALVPLVIQAVVQELSGQRYYPTDKKNNAEDDMSGMSTPSTSSDTSTKALKAIKAAIES